MIGPQTSDDAGVYLLEEPGDGGRASIALAATVDFITPVCDDPRRFGRVAATNALSDVYAMGGTPLFALNLCCFPPADAVPDGVLEAILEGAAEALGEAGAALLGGHSVRDDELKFGLAVVGRVDPEHLLANAGARPGDHLVLTKPLGTGVLINAFKLDEMGAEDLEAALGEMERSNQRAAALALDHGAHGATDVTGFGLVGHALEVARASGVEVTFRTATLPLHPEFAAMVRRGVTTGSTADNRRHAAAAFVDARAGASDDGGTGDDGTDNDGIGDNDPRVIDEALFDPQTSGPLLVALAPADATAYRDALVAEGHRAAVVGEVGEAPAEGPRVVVR